MITFFKKSEKVNTWLVVGLGNPGIEYENTRHNCGFMVLDIIAQKMGVAFTKTKFKGKIVEGKILDTKIILLKPLTYMNLSGESIREALNWYKIPLDRLIITYDDIDLDVGNIRVRANGSAGSHKGMKSVLGNVDSDSFARVRIGIGKNPPKMKLVDYVLGNFTKEEMQVIIPVVERGFEVIKCIIQDGIQKAMNIYNTKV